MPNKIIKYIIMSVTFIDWYEKKNGKRINLNKLIILNFTVFHLVIMKIK